eukprot:5160393-Pyramimonas_sp.AAC.1
MARLYCRSVLCKTVQKHLVAGRPSGGIVSRGAPGYQVTRTAKTAYERVGPSLCPPSSLWLYAWPFASFPFCA